MATYANWVAKTSSLLVEELDLERGDRLRVDLPTHWLGAGVPRRRLERRADRGAPTARPMRTCAAPTASSEYADRAAAMPVVACALRPARRARSPTRCPPDVHDFGVEVWSQPDAFRAVGPGPAPRTRRCRARARRSCSRRRTTRCRSADGDRLLTTGNPVTPDGLATFVQPLVRGGSTVWVRNADPDGAGSDAVRAHERATAEPRRRLSRPGRSRRSPRRGTGGPRSPPDVPGSSHR